MLPGSALYIVGAALLSLLASSIWAELRFARHARLPAHFDVSGRVTRFAPRRVVIWLTPAIFAAVLALIIGLGQTLPPEWINGDPANAVIVSSLVICGAQGFVLWLIHRWAHGAG